MPAEPPIQPLPPGDTDPDLALALAMADEADAITLPRYRASDLKVSSKPDMTPVSEADTAVELAIRRRIASHRPEDAIVGEEYGSEGAGRRRRWIIDPIDGTANYVRGIPVWATLIALHDRDEPRIAVVSAPALGRRWWAARDQGAHSSDRLTGETRRLQVSGVAALAEAQLTISGIGDWDADGRREALFELARRTWRSRGFGEFWSHMLVAEGAVDVFLDTPGVTLWDLAAPQLIVEEAGGRFTDLAGVPTADGGDAVSTNGLLHDEVLAILGR